MTTTPAVPALSTFDFNKNSIRVVTIDEDPWFLATDVRKALEIQQSGHLLDPLGKDEIMAVPRYLIPGRGMNQAQLVSESGLYKLVMRSDKPQAREFQDWVTRIVLPAIRKDGGYILGEEKVKTGEMSEDELVFRALEVMKAKIERLTSERDKEAAQRKLAEAEVLALEPRAAVADQLVERSRTLANIGGKFPGVNRNALTKEMFLRGYLRRTSDGYRVRHQFRDREFGEAFDAAGRTTIKILDRGYELLVGLYQRGQLPMKKGCLPQIRKAY